MNIRRELIAQALSERLNEVCEERLPQFRPDVDKQADFVRSVVEAGKGIARTSPTDSIYPDGWMETDTDCLTGLRELALVHRLNLVRGTSPAIADFLQQLKEVRAQPAHRFRLISERYACPLNVTLPGEEAIREHILERVMVQDRAKIEQRSIQALDSDDILLRLNLIALCAARTSDLRFIDALNYYYELIPSDWRAAGTHSWLQVSYLALYAQALTSVAGKQ